MGERGGGGIGLKIGCIFWFTGRWTYNWRCAYIYVWVCVCVCVCVCVEGGGGRRGGLLGAYMWVLIFYYRSPFSEESLRCLVAVISDCSWLGCHSCALHSPWKVNYRDVWRHVTMVEKFLDFNNLSWQKRPFALSERWKKSLGYCFFLECNNAQEL